MAMNGVKSKAQKRRKRIKRSFAAAIDLLALMMEVGGGFLDSLKIVAKENQGKALGDELAQIVNDVELGKPRRQALENFADRMNDEDISEVIFACNESEELGVPLSETLKVQADRIRQKRSSWAEAAAQQAEVSLVFPAMIIMLASLLTVAAPFVLQGLNVYSGKY
jgi:tight adherence protein C